MVRRRTLANVGDDIDTNREDNGSELSELLATQAPTREAPHTPAEELAAAAHEATTPHAQPTPTPQPIAPNVPLTMSEEEDIANAGINVNPADLEKARERDLKAFINKKVKPTGELYGGGKVSMIALATDVTAAACEGTVKPGETSRVYDAFRKAADDRATISGMTGAIIVPDEKLDGKDEGKSKKQQVSKLRRFVELGVAMPAHAKDVVARTIALHVQAMADDRASLRTTSIYAALLDVAREQLKDRANPFTDAQITDLLTKEATPEREPADGAKKILDALTSATAASRGSKERAPVPSPELDAAIHYLRQALGALNPQALSDFDQKHAAADAQADAPLNTGATPAAPVPPAADEAAAAE